MSAAFDYQQNHQEWLQWRFLGKLLELYPDRFTPLLDLAERLPDGLMLRAVEWLGSPKTVGPEAWLFLRSEWDFAPIALGIEAWARSLNLFPRIWVSLRGFEVLAYLAMPLPFEVHHRAGVVTVGERPSVTEAIAMNLETYGLSFADSPDLPTPPKWAHWQSEKEYDAQVERYKQEMRSYWPRLRMTEPEGARELEAHLTWVCWHIVEGRTYQQIADSIGERDAKTVGEQVQRYKKLLGLRSKPGRPSKTPE